MDRVKGLSNRYTLLYNSNNYQPNNKLVQSIWRVGVCQCRRKGIYIDEEGGQINGMGEEE